MRLTLTIALVVVGWQPAHGFQPLSTLPVHPSATHRASTSTRRYSAVEEERLTEREEEMLFASSSTTPFPTSAKSGSSSSSSTSSSSSLVWENPLDVAQDPLVNSLTAMRQRLESCPQLWEEMAHLCPSQTALVDNHLCDTKIHWTFETMNRHVSKVATLFQSLGVRKGTNVAILGENSAHWLLCDHGLQRAGGVSAVRGADAPVDELWYIYEHSQSAGLAVLQGPRLVQKLAKQARAQNMRGTTGSLLGLANAQYGPVRTIVLMHREKKTDEELAQMGRDLDVKIILLADALEIYPAMAPRQQPVLGREDLATIVYTSGTTGRPKGVMLRHGNLLHQTGLRLAPTCPFEETEPLPGHCMVSLLPVWHITERTFEMWLLTRGCHVVYSSIRSFRNDLAKHKPEWLVLVPRVMEKVASGVQDKFNSGGAAVKALSKFFTNVGNKYHTCRKKVQGLVVGDEAPSMLERTSAAVTMKSLAALHSVGEKLVWKKVQEGFGGNLRAIICGGSALAGSLETFYETAGIPVHVGYGLTECSPLLSYRRKDANLASAGCVGKACPSTEIMVADPASCQQLFADGMAQGEPRAVPTGEVGVVLGRGPQVMLGYFENPKASREVLYDSGIPGSTSPWFFTGDLGRINPATGDLILTGRAKDTIVLSNGENIEPTPIEDAILGATDASSAGIALDQVMLMGQDGRRLVAIAVLSAPGLAEAGYLPVGSHSADELQKAMERVSDPKASFEDCKDDLKLLSDASTELRANASLKKELLAKIQDACKSFRKWEQVGDVVVTLEPFAMSNGLLTQSYKVKRNAVMERYQDILSS